MPTDSESDLQFEIGHVLFIDIVGYSQLLITQQSEQLDTLRRIVRGTAQFRAAEAEGKLLRLPTGDGGALVFQTTPEAPVLCALEIGNELRKHPELKVRMGIHSGPVNAITDLNEQANIAGAGINIAQRVMNCGDAGHILLSRHVAEDLEHYPRWQPFLHNLGECEVKHGLRVRIVNLYRDGIGNLQIPNKLLGLRKHRSQMRWGQLAAALLVLAVVVAAFVVVSRQRERTTATVPNKSIAVLPFENLSSDKDNAYFAEGIQDEILTRLAKIGALKVISRTSTSHYASSPKDLPEIAKQLGVANILEGSVQKVNDAVRINVQLIRAATDDHLWAESYDRKLTDIFGVEAEVAQNIATSLNAKLTGAEQQMLAQKPTNNPEAYQAYLRGSVQFRSGTPEMEKTAQLSFEDAVRLDPSFALAWALLAKTHSLLFFEFEATPAHRAAAEHALTEAMRLQPQLPETQLARAYFEYWVKHDYKGARDMLVQLQLIWPNNADMLEALAYVSARLGDWPSSLSYFDQAIDLNPRDQVLRIGAAYTRFATRDFAGAVKMLDNALEIFPNDTELLGMKATILQSLGDLDEAEKIVATLKPGETDQFAMGAVWNQSIFRREPWKVLPLFQSLSEKTENVSARWAFFDSYYFAVLQEFTGNKDAARNTFEKLRGRIEAALQSQQQDSYLYFLLAVVLTRLGERDLALQAADKAGELSAGDAREHPRDEEERAFILAYFGDRDGAIAILKKLLQTPYDRPITPALLRLDPDWDNLRNDPRFQKLCEEKPK